MVAGIAKGIGFAKSGSLNVKLGKGDGTFANLADSIVVVNDGSNSINVLTGTCR